MKFFIGILIGFLMAFMFYLWSSYVYMAGEKDGYAKKCVDICEKVV